MSATCLKNNSGSPPARRLRAIAARTSDPALADLADEVEALEDRVLFCEAALARAFDALGLRPSSYPAPLHDLPRADAAGVPL